MALNESLNDWLRLTLIPGIGSETQRKLLGAFGLPEAIFSATHSDLRNIIGDRLANALLETDNADLVRAACEWSTGDNQHILTIADHEYPQALLEIADPPTLIYVRGRLDLLNRPALAMVGSRNPTPQGAQNARHFARALAGGGVTIVSGLALGIDAAAHEGALDGSAPGALATIAVIGTGIDRVYPRQHRDLAHRIAGRGLIVSEYPIGTPPLAHNFPRRNRLIAGLSQGTLVVEAALQSGSLITARLASEQGKEVFAIPGSIHSPQSRGCHALIRQGAKLVETAEDVLEELRWPGNLDFATQKEAAGADPASASGPKDPDHALLEALGADPVSLDALQARTGLDTPTLQARLLTLELDGRVGRLPGGLFQRLALS